MVDTRSAALALVGSGFFLVRFWENSSRADAFHTVKRESSRVRAPVFCVARYSVRCAPPDRWKRERTKNRRPSVGNARSSFFSSFPSFPLSRCRFFPARQRSAWNVNPPIPALREPAVIRDSFIFLFLSSENAPRLLISLYRRSLIEISSCRIGVASPEEGVQHGGGGHCFARRETREGNENKKNESRS